MQLYNREPVAAGSFYPSHAAELRSVIKSLFTKKPYTKHDSFLNGLISPHAGYVYSGRIAAKGYYYLSKFNKRTFVIIGPNHTGLGDNVSIMYNAFYKTPFGVVRTNQSLSRELCNELGITNDFLAHSREHSIEVQLPFLQLIYDKISIVPIIIGDVSLATLKRIGSLLAGKNVTIIASSDFTHHGSVYGFNPLNNPRSELRDFDMKAINLIQELRVNDFYELASKGTICGYKPITVLMQAMKEREAKPHFLGYSTSAEVTGDYDNVVAYASIAFK